MSRPLLIATGLAYLWVSAEQFRGGSAAMGAVFLAYAAANAAMCFAVK